MIAYHIALRCFNVVLFPPATILDQSCHAAPPPTSWRIARQESSCGSTWDLLCVQRFQNVLLMILVEVKLWIGDLMAGDPQGISDCTRLSLRSRKQCPRQQQSSKVQPLICQEKARRQRAQGLSIFVNVRQSNMVNGPSSQQPHA